MKYALIILLLFSGVLSAQDHPNLILTVDGVASMQQSLGKTPLFDQSLEQVKRAVDAEIAMGIEVPIPKDLAGGYTH